MTFVYVKKYFSAILMIWICFSSYSVRKLGFDDKLRTDIYGTRCKLNCESDFCNYVMLFMNIPNVEINSVFSLKVS